MFGTRVLSSKLGRALAITALIAAASLHNPGSATAQNFAVGKVIPHMLEVPDQSDQVRGFETLRGTKGLVMLFSRSLAW
ncbi:MAG: hypothetical protein HOK98_07555 [Rhodospirillaceae bacterium]|jgi:hypothetical protein|nr:hypothetical protein [Rhodospirillaceae bacterium]MBT5945156.1 hypothetical protein [Rhodospirillaceae bacterium]MBT6402825.1 hypothetical protein [Rhodospirillaceae bacterium]MBT6536025.1 hypothetical protein [Rhodospirillaceae bacterium]MBT7362171.1 hypothetical protein [Rhodospirillaceae bacterium]